MGLLDIRVSDIGTNYVHKPFYTDGSGGNAPLSDPLGLLGMQVQAARRGRGGLGMRMVLTLPIYFSAHLLATQTHQYTHK